MFPPWYKSIRRRLVMGHVVFLGEGVGTKFDISENCINYPRVASTDHSRSANLRPYLTF